jgi:hypothetical protein
MTLTPFAIYLSLSNPNRSLRASQKIIGEICTAIRENPTVVIWDEEISVREVRPSFHS